MASQIKQEEFNALMPLIVSDLASMIAAKQSISEDDTIKLLYSSELYSLLEDEATKLWHYSTNMLYSLFVQEQTTGTIVFPDV